MQDWLAVHEPGIRLSTFLSVLIAMMIWEVASPRRQPSQSRSGRWTANLLMVAINTGGLESRVPDPGGGHGGGCVGTELGCCCMLGRSPPCDIRAHRAVLALDCLIYGQHVLFHSVSPLWRLHMMHHSDLDFDTTTGVRFQSNRNRHLDGHQDDSGPGAWVATGGCHSVRSPVERDVAVQTTVMCDCPTVSTACFACSWWTPDMHRVHHSIHKAETKQQLRIQFSLVGPAIRHVSRTARDRAHGKMTIGLEQFREPSRLSVYRLLLMPFIDQTGGYPIARKSPRSRSVRVRLTRCNDGAEESIYCHDIHRRA